MKRAIHQSRSSKELYTNIENAIHYVVGYGYDYVNVLDWNVGVFFELLNQIGKVQKAKAGVK
ncbi:MAG: hypothetical protein PHC31_10435 [Clostridia bacterium]|nr:hypothetical protein [Clostridia bacterium]MDD3093550.1 hypothetical protein [Clostridia bacterium]MDD3972316.1 hypothetical protein [Clostridia bacterium]